MRNWRDLGSLGNKLGILEWAKINEMNDWQKVPVIFMGNPLNNLAEVELPI